MIKNICVYGAGSTELDKEYYDAAFDLGAKAAKKGWGVVYGGGNTGVMGYTARGVVSENGVLTGVAPEFMNSRGVLFDNCTRLILTKDMRERKRTMEELSDAFVIMPGGFGTLEEYYEILTGKTLGLHVKPIVLVNIKGIWDGIISTAEYLCRERFTNEECLKAAYVCGNVDDAVSYIENYNAAEMIPRWMKYVAKEDKDA